LLIRLPDWVDTGTLQLTVGGESQPAVVEGGYVKIAGRGHTTDGTLRFLVPRKVQEETVDGLRYTTTWAAYQIVEILPWGSVSPLPF